ncbi:hypothetical protein FW774_01130 (plasmid) [Pedobacter sp. BS3]|uniref:hypothetical protein n=1 Tax=Pedobacter sp. BS3 TaxID=2567937 RepID=UPI0011EC297F|nr:hypothetical protein [Pedobacter sp. BS3]TZF85709.1 hypothetical protein FW774_01130 [Pedobacter sp. BS3]
MKKNNAIKYILSACILTLFGCDKQKASFTEEIYVIGIDPCTKYNSYNLKGYVIELIKSKDTVLTYNLPVETAQLIQKEEPEFKDAYLFASTYSKNYPLVITYRYAKDNEKKLPLCTANTDISGISKINNKQIIINKEIYGSEN